MKKNGSNRRIFRKILFIFGSFLALAVLIIGLVILLEILPRDRWDGFSREEKLVCKDAGGNYSLLNGCGDSCGLLSGEVACITSFSYACDCGSNQCWDGIECVSNESFGSK
jgi:hypothetical protein